MSLNKGYTSTPNYILENENLSLQAKALYPILKSFCIENEFCYPSQETICKAANCSVRSVNYYIKELVDEGYIFRKRTNKSTIYTFKEFEMKKDGCATDCNSDTQYIADTIRNGLQTKYSNRSKENINIKEKIYKKETQVNLLTPSPLCSLILESPELKRRNIVPEQSHIESSLVSFGLAFPTKDLEREFHASISWLVTHPKNRKQNFLSYFRNWLSKDYGNSNGNGVVKELRDENGDLILRRPTAPAEA